METPLLGECSFPADGQFADKQMSGDVCLQISRSEAEGDLRRTGVGPHPALPPS